MDASYSIRNESLHDIVVTMEDDDRERTLRISPNGEAAFKAHMLDSNSFVWGSSSNIPGLGYLKSCR